MKLNNFIQGNADEELMKSLYKDTIDSGKEPSEELVKAMNKAGLVQVQRTVNGKHGTYTRMQWVKASDVKESDRVVGGKKPEEPSKESDKSSVMSDEEARAMTLDNYDYDKLHAYSRQAFRDGDYTRYIKNVNQKVREKADEDYLERTGQYEKLKTIRENRKRIEQTKTKYEKKYSVPTNPHSPIKDLEPDKDSEMTVADYITEDYLDPEDDFEEIENQKKIAKEMGTKPENIHIYTSDTVQDLDYFNEIYNYVVECMDDSKEIGEYTVGTVDGKKVAYSYAEGGLAVLYALD